LGSYIITRSCSSSEYRWDKSQTPVQTVSPDDTNNEEAVAGATDEVGEEETETESNLGTYSDLISRLQDLIDDVVLMKEGSRGTRVGTVQEFLNLYNDTTGGIDNDYGPGTKSKVAAFQKAEGLSADGQAGPNTYRAMIEWLNEQ
jgi:peptidoglycan hydrolase-like protein with peptidoglycan-binding domain